MYWVTQNLIFFFSHCSIYNETEHGVQDKRTIEIHFLSLGRNGKMEDHILKQLSLLFEEQNAKEDRRNRIRGQFLAQLLR